MGSCSVDQSGRRVAQLGRRSKYVLAELDGDETLLIHLGMSGRMTVSGDPLGQFVHDHPMPEKHDHVPPKNTCFCHFSTAPTASIGPEKIRFFGQHRVFLG